MDTLTFIAALIGSLVWPITILLIFLAIRKPIYDLVPLIDRLKYKDFEMHFGLRLNKISDEVENTISKIDNTQSDNDVGALLSRLADISPRAAVLESWRNVELAIIELFKHYDSNLINDRKSLTYRVIKQLDDNKILDKNKISLLKELRALRNDAAHAPEFALSKESALEYASSSAIVIKYLRTLRVNKY